MMHMMSRILRHMHVSEVYYKQIQLQPRWRAAHYHSINWIYTIWIYYALSLQHLQCRPRIESSASSRSFGWETQHYCADNSRDLIKLYRFTSLHGESQKATRFSQIMKSHPLELLQYCMCRLEVTDASTWDSIDHSKASMTRSAAWVNTAAQSASPFKRFYMPPETVSNPWTHSILDWPSIISYSFLLYSVPCQRHSSLYRIAAYTDLRVYATWLLTRIYRSVDSIFACHQLTLTLSSA